MKSLRVPLLSVTAILLGAFPPIFAQDDAALSDEPQMSPEEAAAMKKQQDFLDSINWQDSGTGEMGNRASIEIPEGYTFTGGPGTIKMMEYYGNLTSGGELGYLAPMDMSWFAVFEFEDIGYVKDDEKDELDADKILKDLQEGQEAANEELSNRGMASLTVEGWQTPPFYNETTKNLEWAIRLTSSDGGKMLNYKTKILGRKGVMDVVLVCGEEQLASVIPQYQKLLEGYAFKQEESYASYEEGDKVAKYGLIGLIGGGGLLLAAKSGLLAKLWKPIAAVLVGIGAFFKRFITGNKKEKM